MFRAFRHLNYRLFFAGQGISVLGTWMQSIAQSWLVYELTRSSWWLGLIGFLGAFPITLFSVIGGAVADRLPKRSLIIAADAVLMGQALLFGVLAGSGHAKIWHVALLVIVAGVANAFEKPARLSFVVDMVGKDDLGSAIGLNSALFNSARLIGPAIAGILIARIGTAACFVANSVSFLAAILALLLIRVPPQMAPASDHSMLRSTVEGFRFLRHAPPVAALLVLVATLATFGWSYTVLMPIFADHILGRGPGGMGLLVSCNGIGALLGGLAVAKFGDTVRPRRLVFAGIGIFAVATTVFAVSRLFWLSATALAFVGFGLIMFSATSNTAVQRRVPDELRGRVMGIYMMCFGGLHPVGALIAGALAHHFGAPSAVLTGIAICVAAAVIVARLVPPVSSAVHARDATLAPPPPMW